eukprot:5254401-Lingulodinium_polyedra.AAC.1
MYAREGGAAAVSLCYLRIDWARLRNFLNVGGNYALVEAPIAMVHSVQVVDGATSSLRVFFVGVARFVA